MAPGVAAINALEPSIQSLSDEQLRAKTAEFRQRFSQGETLDDLLPEAFGVVREAGRRTLNMRHFDVQLIGGMVLHRGKIAEMKTGEGKTLAATLPAYLNALAGKGVHVVTVNDYLARRDSEWMGRIYRFLGMTVGVIQHDLNDQERQVAYACDITYGTNNEYGFDYLRDNMKFELANYVQRGHHYAIVDEVDSILIDEARTPLIISGPAEQAPDMYYEVDRIIPRLQKGATTRGDVKAEEREELEKTGDYIVDEKHKTVNLTESGMVKSEKMLAHHIAPGSEGLYDPANMPLLHHINQALRAHSLFHLDVEYMVKDGAVVIVDEFTGRLMPGRRWSDGLHQAVEAKEHNTQHPEVKIERENQTLATITFQNYFRMYKKLAGMTGTAETEAPEFDKIYRLEVIVIPTNRLLLRKENPDIVYRTEKEKYFAAADEIKRLNDSNQPVLVGTTSIEKSERLSDLLKKKGIKHVVLNAKYHEREAEIVAQAGRKGMVTIATNMAGRGTDILLGGNPEFMAKQECVKKGIAQPLRAAQGKIEADVDDPNRTAWYYAGNEYTVPTDQWNEIFAHHKADTDREHQEVIEAGGLHIFGTERHEARRIDNQLRGRAGRQGDPGSSRFYLSLEDDLMRIFAKEWVSNLLQRLGMEEGVPIESRMITRRIEAAQKAVEGQNFEARKHLLEYDDVMNKQRTAVYGLRRRLLEGLDQKDLIVEDYVYGILGDILERTCPPKEHVDNWDLKALKDAIFTRFGVDIYAEGLKPEEMSRQELGDGIFEKLKERYNSKEALIGAEAMRYHERMIMLSVIDAQWKDHLLSMDHLKEGIGLRGYGQHDPLVEYKRESFDMFEEMMQRFQEETVRYLYLMQIMERPPDAGVRPGGDGGSPNESSGPDAGVPSIITGGRGGNGQRPRHVATSVDEIEASFQRKKKKELEQARMAGAGDLQVQQVIRSGDKVGRNDPCPCGSGKKYKKCCGASA
jgi:preprotein translocase subunit SecA